MSRPRHPAQGQMVPPGVWCVTNPVPPDLPPRPGIIVDRDGVLVEEVHYLGRPDDVRLERGAVEFLAAAAARGLPVAVATNQSGIDRGRFGWEQYHAVAERIADLLEERGVSIMGTAACPFHPEHTSGYGPDHDYWRKPEPGLLMLLADRLRLDLRRSWMIGDKASDLAAAKAAGMAGGIHVATGHGASERHKALAMAENDFPVEAVEDLLGALNLLDRIAPGG